MWPAQLHLRSPGSHRVAMESMPKWNSLTLQLLAFSDSLAHIQCLLPLI